MHCPNCRNDNPPTTRFCRECGAVLVESTADGRRRRVLRPWGLPRSGVRAHGLDVSDLQFAGASAMLLAGDAPSRIDRWIVTGLVAVVVGAALLHEMPADGIDVLEASTWAGKGRLAALSKLSAPPMFAEIVLEAPPLAEAAPPTRDGSVSPRSEPARTARGERAPARASVDSGARRSAPGATDPVNRAQEPSRNDHAGGSPVAAQRGPSTANTAANRWQLLGVALARCGDVAGTIPRAMCEQDARLLHCDGFWGVVADCPVARSEYGQ